MESELLEVEIERDHYRNALARIAAKRVFIPEEQTEAMALAYTQCQNTAQGALDCIPSEFL